MTTANYRACKFFYMSLTSKQNSKMFVGVQTFFFFALDREGKRESFCKVFISAIEPTF